MPALRLNFQRALNYLEESRLVMSWVDILDIFVIAAFFSIALVWLRRRTSRSILFALVPLVVTFVVAKSLKMYLTSMVFQFGLMALTLSIVIIFQDDFRRAFESLASWRPWAKGDVILPAKLADVLVECLLTFQREKTGALIVLQGKQSLDPHIRAGVPVRGQLSSPLIQSIFDHHSPGHDGGMTIVDGKVDKLGVHLPLSRNTQATGRLGTRHAAALGLVEKCDALVLVVSEETGTISLGRDGKLQPVKSAGAIRESIREHYRKLGPVALHRSLFAIPWARLTASCVLSIAMWLAFARPTNLIQRMVEIPIVYRSVPKGWEAKPPEPIKVKVTLFGPEGPLMRMDPSILPLTIDLMKVAEGKQKFVLSEADLLLPARVRVKRIEPSEVMVEAYQTVDYEVPIRVVWTIPPNRMLSSQQVRIAPERVSLKMPRSSQPPKFLETEPVDLQELRRSSKMQVKLRLPEDAEMSELALPEVEVAYGSRP